MRPILMILVLVGYLGAIENSNIVLYNETIYNSDKYVLDSMNGEESKGESQFSNKFRLRAYSDLTEDLYVSGTGVYNVNNVSDDYVKFIMYNENYESRELYFESLYVTYNVISRLHLTVGLVNFSEGSYNEISELDYVKGSGLSKIISSSLEAVFLTWNDSFYDWRSVTKLGYGSYDKFNIKKSSALTKNSGDTVGWYLVHDMYKDFDSIKFNYFNVDVAKDGVIVSNSQVVGLGFNKYFLKSGINVFSTLGYTYNVVDVEAVKKFVHDLVGPFAPMVYPQSFELDQSTTQGYLCSLGVNKDFSSDFVESYSIGVDYTYTSEHWYSFVNNDVGDYFNTRYINGDNLYAWVTVRPTKNIAIKAYYNAVRLDKASSIGNNTVTIPFDDSIRPFLKTMDRIGVKLVIKY